MSIESKIKEIVTEQLHVEQGMVENTSRFTDDLGADSLNTVEVIMCLEEEYDIEIRDMDAEKITTVQEAIDYVTATVKTFS